MRLFLPCVEFAAHLLQGCLRLGQRRFDSGQVFLRLHHARFVAGDDPGEHIDFALPLEHSVSRSIRRKERDALPGNDIARRRYAAGFAAQMIAFVERRL